MYIFIHHKINSTLDCDLMNDLTDSEIDENITSSSNKIPPLSNWEKNPLFSKCGIIPAELVSNQHSHAKFFIHWLFNSHHSFKLTFRLEFIENYTNLNYYYSIRTYTGQEIFTKAYKFHETNETNEADEATLEESLELKDDLKKELVINTETVDSDLNKPVNLTLNDTSKSNKTHEEENHLLFNFDPVPHHYQDKYDIVNNMYVICVIIVNIKDGLSFTLPFMCVDIFLDKKYYKHIKLESDDHERNMYRKHSLGMMITLGPLCVIAFILIGVMYHKTKADRENEMLARLNSVPNPNMLLANKLLKSLEIEEPDETITRVNGLAKEDEKIGNFVEMAKRRMSEFSNDVKFTRYDLFEDMEKLPTKEETFIQELEPNFKLESKQKSDSLDNKMENFNYGFESDTGTGRMSFNDLYSKMTETASDDFEYGEFYV